MKNQNVENLELDYRELSFIMDIKTADAKEIFIEVTGMEKVKVAELVSVQKLVGFFNSVASIDPRFDKKNSLILALEQKQNHYKKFLSKPQFVKAKKFKGGASIFYKILDTDQLIHANQRFESNFVSMGFDKLKS